MEAHTVYAESSAATAIVTASETILTTLPSNVTVSPGTLIIIEGIVTITTGTAASALVLRVRRGAALAGAVVGQPITWASNANLANSGSIQVSDTPGEVAGGQYILTVVQTAASTNGANVFSSLQATWIS